MATNKAKNQNTKGGALANALAQAQAVAGEVVDQVQRRKGTTSNTKPPKLAKRISGDFYGFKSSNRVFSFGKNPGKGVTLDARELQWLENFKTLANVDEAIFSINLRLGPQASLCTFELPLGLTVIMGGTKGGKTQLLRLLKARIPNMVIAKVVEPQDSLEELFDEPLFNDVDTALASMLFTHYTDKGSNASPELFALDSLRAPLFEIAGSAGSKGIIMAFFTQLTRVSNALAANGITMLATINPMDTDAAYVTEFSKKLSAAVPCFMELKSISKDSQGSQVIKGDLTVRRFETVNNIKVDPREPIAFTIVADEGEVLLPVPLEITMPDFEEEYVEAVLDSGTLIAINAISNHP